MKKKALLLVSLCVIGLFTWAAHAINLETKPLFQNNEVSDMPNEIEKIELLGDLLYNVGPNAIEAGATDDAVYIQFNQSFGIVNISIYNSMGSLAYSTVANSNVQQLVIIPFSSVASGNYTVELSNANGYAEGDFEHN